MSIIRHHDAYEIWIANDEIRSHRPNQLRRRLLPGEILTDQHGPSDRIQGNEVPRSEGERAVRLQAVSRMRFSMDTVARAGPPAQPWRIVVTTSLAIATHSHDPDPPRGD
jgi:hypothetical protein